MIKKMFTYWEQGFDNAPPVVQGCLKSWRELNQDWEIIQLDSGNLDQYISIDSYIYNIQSKTITRTSMSDIIRIILLNNYGGLWVDATALCLKPLDEWLPACVKSGFFAFAGDEDREPLRLLASWFIYSEPHHYLAENWLEKVIDYWEHHDRMHAYFWFHFLHLDLCKHNKAFRNSWRSVPKVKIAQDYFGLEKMNDHIRSLIEDSEEKVIKLTYKYSSEEFTDDCVLSYIMNNKMTISISDRVE